MTQSFIARTHLENFPVARIRAKPCSNGIHIVYGSGGVVASVGAKDQVWEIVMEGEKSIVLSIAENRRFFIEEQAFYELILVEDHDYMLPRHASNLPSSGFYIQVSFGKFLPHKQSTLDKDSNICLVLPYSGSDNNVDDEDEILKQAVSLAEELPVHVEEKMKEVVKKFMDNLKIEKNLQLRPRLVPVFMSIVATVFSSEVKDVFLYWKKRILTSHGVSV